MTTIANKSVNPMKQKDIMADKAFNIFVGVMVALVLIVTLYPIYLVIICSFSDATLVTSGQVTLYPRGVTMLGYNAVFQNQELIHSFFNSVLYTVAGTAISLVVTMGAAFTLSRKFPGK